MALRNIYTSLYKVMGLSRFFDYFRVALMALISIILLFSVTRPQKNAGEIKATVSRIVSLSPSLTRQIVDLDSEKFLVGVSTFHPPLSRNIEVVSSIVSPDAERIFMLRPDCVILMSDDVIAYRASGISSLGIPVKAFAPVNNFDDICNQFRALAGLIHTEAHAEEKIRYYRDILSKITRAPKIRCAFFLSNNPPVAAGGKSFINALIEDAGGENVFADITIAYPLVSIEQIVLRKPEMLITMVRGGASSLEKQIRESAGSNSKWDFMLKEVSDEHIPYYSPADYCASVALLADVLGSGRKMK